MQGTITIITPNGDIALDQIDGPPPLEKLQVWIGGWIERVPGFDRREDSKCVALADEEGILKKLPVNWLATEMWHAAAPQFAPQALRGTVVIIEGDEELLGAL